MAQKPPKVTSESSSATVLKFPSDLPQTSKILPAKNGYSPDTAGATAISFHRPKGKKEGRKEEGNSDPQSPEWAHVKEANADIWKLSLKELKAKWPVLHERTYVTWENAKQRGKKVGIADDFKTYHRFLILVGFKPYPSASLDRIDPAKGYYPDNVRWANKQTQSENKVKPPRSESVFPIGKAEEWEKAFARERLQHDTRQFFMLRTARRQMEKLMADIKQAGTVMDNIDGEYFPSLRLTPENEGALRPLVNRLAYFYECWRQAEHLIRTRPPEYYRLVELEHRNTGHVISLVGVLLQHRCKKNGRYVDPRKLPRLTEWGEQLLIALHGKVIAQVEEVLGLMWALVDEKSLPQFSDTPRPDTWTYPKDTPTMRHEHFNA